MKKVLLGVMIVGSFFATDVQAKGNKASRAAKALQRQRIKTAKKSTNEEIPALVKKFLKLSATIRKAEGEDKEAATAEKVEVAKKIDALLAAENEDYKALVEAASEKVEEAPKE